MDEPIRFYEIYDYKLEYLVSYLMKVQGYCEYDFEVFKDTEDIADHIIASGYTIDALKYLSQFEKGK